MKIGILTFYREINFGANLQALSTYGYLIKHGHEPIFIYYYSDIKEKMWGPMMEVETQPRCHKEFIDNVIKAQTTVCRNATDVNEVIENYKIEAIIVGSDAVLQHHPLIDRLKFCKRRVVSIIKTCPDNSYPNPFWGAGIKEDVKMAIMSASSQDSEFFHFSKSLKDKMKSDLSRFSYISVRDDWTQKMLHAIFNNDKFIPITPDPVFNFNNNAGNFIPSKEKILEQFNIPERYVLISLFGQHLSFSTLTDLKNCFSSKGLSCVALPMQTGYHFSHPFDYEIPIPLCPSDWYALIKYSQGYIGNNMHPIVVALHNAVPCFSIDFYGTTDFWGRPRKETTSKIFHILKCFGIEDNYCRVIRGHSSINASKIANKIISYPTGIVKEKAKIMTMEYERMMHDILFSFCE